MGVSRHGVTVDEMILKRILDEGMECIGFMAVGVNSKSFREVIVVYEGAKYGKEGWSSFLKYLNGQGLKGVKLFIGDKCLRLIESLREWFPAEQYQRCLIHFFRNVFTNVPKGNIKNVVAMLKRSMIRGIVRRR